MIQEYKTFNAPNERLLPKINQKLYERCTSVWPNRKIEGK